VTSRDEREPELGEVEWLDVGPVDHDRPPSGPRPVWRGWYLLVGLAVVIVVVALTVGRHSSHKAAPRPTPTPTSSRPTPTSTPPLLDPTTSAPPVQVSNVGRPLLNAPASWDVFAYGGDTVLRIQLAAGRITRTRGVITSGGGPGFIVPGSHGLVVGAWDPGTGYLVPDGRPPQNLPGALARGGSILPGPDPDQVWVSTNSAGNPRTELIGLDGRPAGVSVPVNATMSDGVGYMVAGLTGGTYDVRPGSIKRITSGALLAIGATRWLTEECDDQHRCTRDVIDRATGERRVLGPAADTNDPPGVISADGRTAAVLSTNAEGLTTTLHFVDLASGADQPTSLQVNRDAGYTGGAMAWTPDGRWLLAIDSSGRVVAIDRGGHIKVLASGYPVMIQLAFRS
jgi:hypothetical protein